jgi:hypothetical protein
MAFLWHVFVACFCGLFCGPSSRRDPRRAAWSVKIPFLRHASQPSAAPSVHSFLRGPPASHCNPRKSKGGAPSAKRKSVEIRYLSAHNLAACDERGVIDRQYIRVFSRAGNKEFCRFPFFLYATRQNYTKCENSRDKLKLVLTGGTS